MSSTGKKNKPIVKSNEKKEGEKEVKVLNLKELKVDDTDENFCSFASSIKEDTSGDSIEKVSESKKGEAMESEPCVDSLNSSIPELPVTVKRPKKIPILDPTLNINKSHNILLSRRRCLPISKESLQLNLRPLVFATHLVPSLPISLFEIFAAIVEEATETPVVLLGESRPDRPVAKDIVDIAFLPTNKTWDNGVLLPIGIIFEHPLNKLKTPGVYTDIVVSGDIIETIEDIIDLRGYRCALPDRNTRVGPAGLLFSHLNSKGEGPSFFGNTLDTETQLATIQMVASKQADVGVLESPVINCHKYTLPGMKDLYILDSLGPLPPYQIMINKKLPDKQRDIITNCLLNIHTNKEWMEKLSLFGILGFTEYCKENYNVEEIKSVVTSVPYY